MNKLLGLFDLKDSGLPTIPWKEYEERSVLDENILWSVRTAVHRGNDLNLPRFIGVTADEAVSFAKNTKNKYRENGMIIYYPYFIAEKSGTLNVFNNKVVIEAVKDDLWNMVTYLKRNVTIILENNKEENIGERNFLKSEEVEEITSYIGKVKMMYRDELIEGKSALLEWSYAYKCDINKNRIGDKYLVFYEARTV